MTINLLTAILLGVAAFSLGVREIALSPVSRSFPCAPRSVRAAMFMAAVSLAAASMLFGGHGDRPYAGQAATAVAALAGIMALYNVVMLLNVLSLRFSPGTWDRLNRLQGAALHRRHMTAG